MLQSGAQIKQTSVSRTSLFADVFWLRKLTTDPHILAHVSIDCLDDMYPKLNIYISELVLDRYEYITLACVTMYCMI
jgi:hypothetical protein